MAGFPGEPPKELPPVTIWSGTRRQSPLPQPITGFVVALIVLGVILFISPPAARLWIAALVLVMALAVRGRAAAGIIDNLRKTLYGA